MIVQQRLQSMHRSCEVDELGEAEVGAHRIEVEQLRLVLAHQLATILFHRRRHVVDRDAGAEHLPALLAQRVDSMVQHVARLRVELQRRRALTMVCGLRGVNRSKRVLFEQLPKLSDGDGEVLRTAARLAASEVNMLRLPAYAPCLFERGRHVNTTSNAVESFWAMAEIERAASSVAMLLFSIYNRAVEKMTSTRSSAYSTRSATSNRSSSSSLSSSIEEQQLTMLTRHAKKHVEKRVASLPKRDSDVSVSFDNASTCSAGTVTIKVCARQVR